MTVSERPAGTLPRRLARVVERRFEGSAAAARLVARLLATPWFDHVWATALIETARDADRPWPERYLAILALEHQVSRLRADDRREQRWVLEQLGLLIEDDGARRVRDEALLDGFSSLDPEGFAAELRLCLAVNGPRHERLDGERTSAAALDDLLSLARQPCRLFLARYLLDPEEVFDDLRSQVETTDWMPAPFLSQTAMGVAEAERALARLPVFERRLVARLLAAECTYWVSEKTSSELFSLIEYPLTTVVLVVKPPGSSIELEIKRAGLRGKLSLTVVSRRGGTRVPPSHRLQGGSMGLALRWEAMYAARLARIYRRVHGEEAPIPITVSLSSILQVPTRMGPRYLSDFFRDARVFGEDFPFMQRGMRESLRFFARERKLRRGEIEDEHEAINEFLIDTKPAQAVMIGSSSLRLDKAAEYLSPEGAEIYYKQGLGVRYGRGDERRLADDVLGEVLGEYRPPAVRGVDYGGYLEAAYAMPANRERANEVYLSILESIGRFWGTLLGMRGCTRGESFVARNVGLKRVWEGGRWRVKIIFMDHDQVNVYYPAKTMLKPIVTMGGTEADESFIGWLRRGEDEAKSDSELPLLARIYRVSATQERRGERVFSGAAVDAYKLTQRKIRHDPAMAEFFHSRFIYELRHWDHLVRIYLESEGGADGPWQRRARRYLTGLHYEDHFIEEHIRAVRSHRIFLERASCFYLS